MKNSKILIAVVISMVFIVAWDALVVSRYTKTPPAGAKAVTLTTEKKPVIASEAKQSQDGAKLEIASATQRPRNDGPTQINLKTETADVTVVSKGGAVSKWVIREEDGNWVELVETAVLQTLPDTAAALSKKSDNAVTAVAEHEGFRVAKTLTLNAEPPYHELNIAVTNTANVARTLELPLVWKGGLHRHIKGSDPKARDADAAKAEMRVAAYTDRVQSWKAGFIFNRTIDANFPGPFTWVGIDNNHFLAAILPKASALDRLHVMADRDNPPSYELPVSFSLAPHETKTQTFKLYVGPKKYREMQKLGNELDKSVDFGAFGFISKGLLRALEFFQGITHNYGWAIILLTISIQILVFPLTKKSLSHAVRMKEVQPQIKALQEKFKGDQKRMQIEMFNLYRKNNMKFMGMEGCFPILLQIPIFFAFYTTLHGAYELRGASWMWIPDLGLHDPIYILPILMGVGMFLQQKMTTVAADPAQAKVMMFMPVIMTFMFLKLPAGLVLYWTVNSICTIVIQKFLQWRGTASPKPA